MEYRGSGEKTQGMRAPRRVDFPRPANARGRIHRDGGTSRRRRDRCRTWKRDSCNPKTRFIARTAEIGRVGEHGIDDQGAAAIVGAEFKADLILPQQYETSRDGLRLFPNFLIDTRGFQP